MLLLYWSVSSSQPLDISTALVHPLYIFALASLDISGLKIFRSDWLISFSSSNSFQTSTAKPAAMAAPRAVVSRITGRSTGIPVMSAWVCDTQIKPVVDEKSYSGMLHTCIQRSELLIPPSTASWESLWPLSFSIASKIALV